MATAPKILVVGPKGVGKSSIANLLAGISERPSAEYMPTAGVRILEFERDAPKRAKFNQSQRISMELWDCSGDLQYETGWPALVHDVKGCILVFDPDSATAEKDVEDFHRAFVQGSGLKDSQVIMFGHRKEAGNDTRPRLPRVVQKIPLAMSNIDSNSSGISAEFTKLIASIVAVLDEESEKAEEAVMA